MRKLETPVMAALLASLVVFLFTKALVVFVFMIACALAVVTIALTRVIRT